MKRILLSVAMFGFLGLVSGCGDETKVESKEKVSTPGGSVEKTTTEKTTKTGDQK